MPQMLTQDMVLEFLRSQVVDYSPEGKRITIGNSTLAASPIADCDLSELMEHLYQLERMGRITLAHRHPIPFDEHRGLVTDYVFVHDDLLPYE